ncbi:antirestriction protein ArdA [Calidifontibacter terrae]
MTAVATDQTPRVWIGCLNCYNSGRLVGQWFECSAVLETAIADIHSGAESVRAGCEETWCLDHENVPVRGEFGPLDAAEWGRVYEEAGAERWPAVMAWVRSGSHVTEGRGDIPSMSDFDERYCGHWESFREYAEDLADSAGLTEGWPEDAIRYFNWASWTSDLKHDYVVCDAGSPDCGVYIFRNL